MNSFALNRLRHLATLMLAFLAACIVLSGMNVPAAFAAPSQQAPTTVAFEGYLADSGGNALSGTYTLKFRLYDAATGSTAFWTEEHTSVPVSHGLYSVQLGSVTTLPSDAFDGQRWLSVEVNNSGAEMSPRIAVTAVPWAFNATNASSAQALQGVAVSSATPTEVGQVLSWNGSAWAPAQVLQNGLLGLAQGGTGADLSSTGPGWLRQVSSGSTVTVAVPKLSDLDDVSKTLPGDGQTLVWNEANNMWVPGSAMGSSVPSGAVMYFNLPVCPSGWTEVLTARGRYVVGLQPGVTPGTPVGTELSYLENRPVGKHTHTITDPGHSHTLTAATAGGYHFSGNSGAHPMAWDDLRTTSNTPTGITINNAGTIDGTNAPYIQLLVCQKSGT